MSRNLVYHSVRPENEQVTYTENDQIDFILTFEGRKMIPSSLRIEGDVMIVPDKNAPTTINNGDFYQLDRQAGAHSLFDSWSTELQTKGIIESIRGDYPRYVKMFSQANRGVDDYCVADMVCELRSPNDYGASLYTKISKKDDTNTDNTNGIDFSIKPMIAVNKIQGGNISFNKTGYIKLTTVLSRNTCVNGCARTSVDSFGYVIRNLKAKFLSVPEDNKNSQLVVSNVFALKSAITSNFANISSKVPATCSGVSISFLKKGNEHQNTSNPYATNVPPDLREVQFLFNDNTQNLITYVISKRNDMQEKYIRSLGGSMNNELTMTNQGMDDGFGVGVTFDDLVDLSNQKFNAQINSGIDNTNEYLIYMFFHGLMKL